MAEPSHHHRCAGIRLGTNSPDPGSALRPCSKTRLCTDKLVIFTMMLLLIKYLYSIDRKQEACKAKSEVIFLLLALFIYCHSRVNVCAEFVITRLFFTFICWRRNVFLRLPKRKRKEVRAFQKHWNLDLVIISTQQCLMANCWWTELH